MAAAGHPADDLIRDDGIVWRPFYPTQALPRSRLQDQVSHAGAGIYRPRDRNFRAAVYVWRRSSTAPNQASKFNPSLPHRSFGELWMHMARQHRERKALAEIYTLAATIIEGTLNEGRTQYSKRSEMFAKQSIEALRRLHAWLLCNSDEQLNRRCIQILTRRLGTGKATRPTINSDFVLDSGATVHVAKLRGLRSTAYEDLHLMLHSAASDRTHVTQSNNLTDERSDKPRSNSSTPATNSSGDTTRNPVVQNKLITDGQNDNHSGPDACVDDRDTSASKGQATWYMATGAARNATGDSSLITNLVPLEPENGEGGLCVHAADGTPMPVLGHGSVVTQNVVLPDVYYVPGLLTNLVSVGQLAGLDYSVGFGRGACVVSSPDGETVGRAHAGKDGLYEVEFLRVPLDMR